jgi:hypothetical protein
MRWAKIDGYPYSVSDTGLVRNDRKGRILKGRVLPTGYVYVQLGSIKKNFYIHRLVATCFIENPDAKPEVNHIDGNKSNNRVDNLEWVTRSENNIHKYRILNFQNENLFKSRRKKVICEETGIIYESLAAAQKATGVLDTHICRCTNGKRKTAGGFHWRYV